MLVLTRKEGETIVIDGQIKITVVRTRGRAIRLAIEAPRDMRVLRGELATTTVDSTAMATACAR